MSFFIASFLVQLPSGDDGHLRPRKMTGCPANIEPFPAVGFQHAMTLLRLGAKVSKASN
jgi:hypothetical protein